MAKQELDKTFEVSSEFWNSFRVVIRKGKVIECSDQSHPMGTDWKQLQEHYKTRPYEVEIKEVKE